jgi:formamidopyrimidine-DNA glycosylase
VPELPDVEGYRRFLAKHARGRKIVRVDAPDRVLVRNRTPKQLTDALKDRPFKQPRRHGKWLIAPVDGVELLLHFGMTGLLSWRDTDRDRHLHDRIIFVTDRGERCG